VYHMQRNSSDKIDSVNTIQALILVFLSLQTFLDIAGIHWIFVVLAFIIGLFQPYYSLHLLVATIPLELISVTEASVTWTRLVGVAVATGWIANRLMSKASFRKVDFGLKSLGSAILLVIWGGISSIYLSSSLSFETYVLQYVQLVALCLIVIDTTTSKDHLDLLIQTLILATILAAVLTIREYYSASQLVGAFYRAGDNIAGNENRTATTFTIMLPFAAYLLRSSRSRMTLFTGLAAVILLPIGVALTFSRTSYVLLIIVTLLTVIGLRGRNSRNLWLGLLVALLGFQIIVGYLVPREILTDRIDSIPIYVVEQDTRIGHWHAALLMYADHPLIGVGLGNFGLYFVEDYQFKVNLPRLFTSDRSPHSSIFGIMAELGTVGILLWGALQINVLNRISEKLQTKVVNSEYKWILLTIFLVLIVYNLYGVFTVVDNHKLLWICYGFALALVNLIEESSN